MFGLFNMLIQNLSQKGSIASAVMYDDEFAKVTVTINNEDYEVTVYKKAKENENA